MNASQHRITQDDILPAADYAARRADIRRELLPIKKLRRVAVGPYATFLFENYQTMWQQVQEMLFIEKGGAEQVEDELRAYNPLIPQGRELVATLLFEIDQPETRRRVLSSLGGVEEHIFLDLDGSRIPAIAERDVDRTSAAGKASSVHFLHFPFTAEQIMLFRQPGQRVALGIAHPAYGHLAALSEPSRAELARDFGS